MLGNIGNLPGKEDFKISQKVALLQISRNFLLFGATGLQSAGYSVIKNKLLTKFLTEVLKILQHLQEELSNGVLF